MSGFFVPYLNLKTFGCRRLTMLFIKLNLAIDVTYNLRLLNLSVDVSRYHLILMYRYLQIIIE